LHGGETAKRRKTTDWQGTEETIIECAGRRTMTATSNKQWRCTLTRGPRTSGRPIPYHTQCAHEEVAEHPALDWPPFGRRPIAVALDGVILL
jgi:hypothetical protein